MFFGGLPLVSTPYVTDVKTELRWGRHFHTDQFNSYGWHAEKNLI